MTTRLAAKAVTDGSWEEQLALLLPDEFDDVGPILVAASEHSHMRSSDAQIRPWALLALDELRSRWADVRDPWGEIDSLLFVLGEPERYDMLRPWNPAVSGTGPRTLAAIIDSLLAVEARSFATESLTTRVNERARSGDRLAHLPASGVRVAGIGAMARWVTLSVSLVFAVAITLGVLYGDASDGQPADEPAFWALVVTFGWGLVRAPFLGVFVTPRDIRVVSLVTTRTVPIVDISAITIGPYLGYLTDGGISDSLSTLGLDFRDGRSRALPVTVAGNRRLVDRAEALALLVGVVVRRRGILE